MKMKHVFRNIKLFVIAIELLRWFTVETAPGQGTLLFVKNAGYDTQHYGPG